MRQFRRNVVHAGGGLNEFLPDQQTQLIAEAVERFRLNHAPPQTRTMFTFSRFA